MLKAYYIATFPAGTVILYSYISINIIIDGLATWAQYSSHVFYSLFQYVTYYSYFICFKILLTKSKYFSSQTPMLAKSLRKLIKNYLAEESSLSQARKLWPPMKRVWSRFQV